MSKQRPQRIVVAITGASGAAYAQRMVQLLLDAGVEVHLVISPLGQRIIHDELGMERVDLEALIGGARCGREASNIILHAHRNVGASIASGSFLHDGMIIVPCSSSTLSAVALGSAQNLCHRAAHVTLKQRRPLILVHRETPLSLVDIRNMEKAAEAGAIVCPANPGFYMMPRSIEDLLDFICARVLDLLGIGHDLPLRWGEAQAEAGGGGGGGSMQEGTTADD